MLRVFGAVCGLGLGLSGAAHAQTGPVVVELFTAQGCSACPPADALLDRLADDPRVLALALHVDYWDYIGWKDNFGKAAHTLRQKAYARMAGSRMLYTPQFIVEGRDRIEGTQPEKLMQLIDRHATDTGPDLTAVRSGADLEISAPAADVGGPVQVQLVRFRPQMSVDITRGENAGKSVDYANIVTDWQIVGTWDGTTPLEVRTPFPGDEPAVVILQADGPGDVLAARRID